MILDEIVEAKRQRLIEHKNKITPGEMRRRAEETRGTPHSLKEALKKPGISIIGEFKQASPSLGEIKSKINLSERIEAYNDSVDAISCLTEPEYFLGRDRYLEEIAGKVRIPVLRKDFTVDAYQIYEAKVLGASAILLICSILSDEQLREYIRIADGLGLSALVEAHDEQEIRRALSCGARILGVNNRNLKDFTVNVENSLNLRKHVPEEIIFVAESGIRTAEDIERLRQGNVQAVLIGETLMRCKDKKTMLAELRGDGTRQPNGK